LDPCLDQRGILTRWIGPWVALLAFCGCVSANFATVAVGQEGLASIRRPSTWNSIVGMRTTAGLASRGGVYSGWPEIAGALGPMTRTVTDLAMLLDVMVV
jgi:Asp-tRNA(Asn)/Glu-tRNA(Gln) amidotransferase A subunit family amidase